MVSKHWADALESEWTSQLLLEQHLHLPTSVKPSTDLLSQARTQVFFTQTFAFPLFQLTASAIPRELIVGLTLDNLPKLFDRNGAICRPLQRESHDMAGALLKTLSQQ